MSKPTDFFVAVLRNEVVHSPEYKKRDRGDSRDPSLQVTVSPRTQAFSSRICFFTLDGTSAYFSGSIALAARPVLMDRSSVV
jgi:hypothetical protein